MVIDKDLKGADQTAAEIKSLGHRVLAIKVDVTDSVEVNGAVEKALKEFGKIDILVNIAGATTSPKLFIEKTEEEWDRDLNLNLKGTLYCIKAVLPRMLSRKCGKIITIASVNIKKGFPTTSFMLRPRAE